MKIFTSKNTLDLIIVYLAILINFFIHNLNLGKNQEVFTDAGVYIYSAKLINLGLIPYRDFFLAHPPLLIFIAAFWLQLSSNNIIHFHQIYILWMFSSLIPIYFLSLHFTKSRLAGLFSVILFSTFPELIQWDAHSFALRHTSIPFLTYALWFISLKKPTLAVSFLAFFAATTISNLFLATIILTLLIFQNIHTSRPYKKMLILFLLLVGSYYLLIFLIPNAYENLILYQQARVPNSSLEKISIFQQTLILSWPIIIFGLLGSVLLIFKMERRLLGIFNLIALPMTIFANSYFYGHYITILAPTYAIAGGYLLRVNKKFYIKIAIFIFGIICIYQTSFNYLYFQLYQKQTTEFNRSINIIEQFPGKLLTFEPIFALFAHKDLPLHYYVADSRSLLVRPTNLNTDYFNKLIQQSDIILLDNLLSSQMPLESQHLVYQNFQQVDHNSYGIIFIRKQ